MAIMFVEKESNSPLILSSPHSGNYYPNFFINKIDVNIKTYRSIEDMFVSDLIQDLSDDEFTKHVSKFSRAVIDLNRDKREVDPNNFTGKLNFDPIKSSYVKSGIGLIPLNSPKGQLKYKKNYKVEELMRLINEFYEPWHLALKEKIENKLNIFDGVFLIDCHSMPSRDFINDKDLFLPDFILGDCFGKTFDNRYVSHIESFLKDNHFSVSRNKPYSGGYITKNYFNVAKNIQTLQIEIRRDLYMDEVSYKKNRGFGKIKDVLTELITSLNKKIIEDICPSKRIAAQ